MVFAIACLAAYDGAKNPLKLSAALICLAFCDRRSTPTPGFLSAYLDSVHLFRRRTVYRRGDACLLRIRIL